MRVIGTIIITLALVLSSFNLAMSSVIEETKDSYVIEGVPYIGQNEAFYCNWACFTMVLQHYGINASLNEVLFNHGMGYSQQYSNSDYYRLPRSGHHMSINPYNYLFLSEIYGLSFTPNKYNYSSEKKWDVNWPKIKENLTKNIPVIVFVNELVLLSDYMQKQGEFRPQRLITDPSYLGIHFVLVLGFNETDNTICYNDPSYQMMDKTDIGTYRWTDIETFRLAHESLPVWYSSEYDFQVFKKVREPMTKDEAFVFAHNRNIERLKGNRTAYYPYGGNWSNRSMYGIKASILLKSHFEDPEKEVTIKAYKLHGFLTGFYYDFLNRLYKIYRFLKSDEKTIYDMIMTRLISFYDHVYYDKKYTADYLNEAQNILQDENLLNICKYELELFNNEAENWSKLANCYTQFISKGLFITNFRAVHILVYMDEAISNIIEIEEKIITGPP